MRLWHQALLPYLDKKRLFGQHRECCALRGKGWGKKHSVVDYVFKHGIDHLYEYHVVMYEIEKQFNANIEPNWLNRLYRGKNLPESSLTEVGIYVNELGNMIYPEHDDRYMLECLMNLKAKGAELVNGKTLEQMLIEYELKV